MHQPYARKSIPGASHGHVHLRGQNRNTQCGVPITDAIHAPGLPGFRLAHGTVPASVCLKCLAKSRNLHTVNR
jgi:hypothetical protein